MTAVLDPPWRYLFVFLTIFGLARKWAKRFVGNLTSLDRPLSLCLSPLNGISPNPSLLRARVTRAHPLSG